MLGYLIFYKARISVNYLKLISALGCFFHMWKNNAWIRSGFPTGKKEPHSEESKSKVP